MTEKADTEANQGLQGRLRDLGGALRDIGGAALRETLGWSAYQWTVLALLTAIFLLIALSYGGIRTELAALKENAGGGQFYFPGRERGCLSVLLVIAVLAVAWSAAG